MGTQTEAAREFWRGVLAAGGFTAIPRWTLDPVPGVAEHEETIPDDLAAALRRLADELGVSLSAVLLAAHAKVLAALSGERGGRDRLRRPVRAARPLPCRLTTEPESWRALVLDTQRVESDAAGAPGLPGRRPPARAGPDRAVVRDRVRPDRRRRPTWPRTPCCGSGPRSDDDRLALRLRYRTDVLDAEAAARIAGYHLTALALIAADPDAEHRRAEPALRRGARSSSSRGWPDRAGSCRTAGSTSCSSSGWRRTRTPSRPCTATGSGPTGSSTPAPTGWDERCWRAGCSREGVVAVVTERNLDWMAAVLAVFKAGGVYLPIEPHFPADRIATTLSRAECGLVLTEPGSTTTLDKALDSLPGVADALRRRRPTRRTTPTATSASSSRPTSSPTSTSPPAPPASPRARCASTRACSTTSTPRSTTCEIGEGQVVAQTAPQCFDISLWQLVSALLVGGRTLLIEQEVILDVERFVDTIVDGRVARAAGRAVLPRGRAVLPGAAPPRAARPAVRVGHRRGAEEGARAALVRDAGPGSGWSTPTG